VHKGENCPINKEKDGNRQDLGERMSMKRELEKAVMKKNAKRKGRETEEESRS